MLRFSKALPRTTLAVVSLLSCLYAHAEPTLRFSEACSQNQDIEIFAVGDILLHSPLQKQAATNPQRFKSLWSSMLPYIQKADIAYANLEGPVASGQTRSGQNVEGVGLQFDNNVYTSYPLFNYHPLLVQDIKSSGFDIVSTANNHAMDRRSIGVDKTIEELERNHVLYTGTRKRSDSSNPDYQWYTLTHAKGRTIAWLACSFSTNGNPDPMDQVLPCFENQSAQVLGLVHRLSRDPHIDAVIVTPHWGIEYQLRYNAQQSTLGRQLIEAGATAVIATHPHVVQPWQKITTSDGREGLIVYSTGNFVSNQSTPEQRTSVMIQLHLTGAPQAKLKIRGVSYLPLFMQRSPILSIQPVYDLSTTPPQAQSIWERGYGDEQRIRSLDEDQVAKICRNSRN